jgi:hypothetical protein
MLSGEGSLVEGFKKGDEASPCLIHFIFMVEGTGVFCNFDGFESHCLFHMGTNYTPTAVHHEDGSCTVSNNEEHF